MKKQTKLITTAIIIILAVAGFVATYYATLPTSETFHSNGEPPQGQLTVTGEVSASKNWSTTDLANMPQTNITYTRNGETNIYTGVSLTEFCNQTNIDWYAGTLTFTSSNGNQKTLTLYQAWNSSDFPSKEIILALEKNGSWLTEADGGPVQLVAPDLGTDYQVTGVNNIEVGLWVLQVNGLVSTPLSLTGKNITAFGVETFQTVFAPGGAPQRTSNWTGVDLWSILQAAGVSENATTITVTAADRYSQVFDITLAKDCTMKIGFEENDQYFDADGGRPFRLVLNADNYKWGRYWVRWVTQVTVS